MTAGVKKKAPAPTGTGRPRFFAEAMKPHTVRTTDAQWEKVERLGGAAWVRDRIDKAKDPAEQ